MLKPSRRHVLQSLGTLGVGAAAAVPMHEAAAATPGSALTSRISRFEVIPTKIPFYEPVREAWTASFFRQNRFQTDFRPTMVKIHTDEGLVGICNASMPNQEQIHAKLKSMVGRSPWEFLLDDSLRGLLVAVYDLIGQAAGLPVSRLFGTSPKERIVQTWWSQCYPPDLMAAEAQRGEKAGYKVHKVKARPWEDPIAQAEAICSVVGSDFRIWADANAWWGSIGRTVHFCEGLAKLNNYFAIESPIKRPGIEGYRQLKGKLPLQLSEHMTPDPMPYIREGLLDSFVIGGPMGKTLVQRALMAEVTKIPLWVEHSIEDGINQVFQAHQAAALPGIEYTISITHVLEDDLMVEPFTMKDGFYEVPTKPGLGVSLDEAAVDKYRVA
jgi:D-galactarolactone cycloisomerase